MTFKTHDHCSSSAAYYGNHSHFASVFGPVLVLSLDFATWDPVTPREIREPFSLAVVPTLGRWSLWHFSRYFFLKNFIELQLFYDVVFISSLQQNDSLYTHTQTIYIYIYIHKMTHYIHTHKLYIYSLCIHIVYSLCIYSVYIHTHTHIYMYSFSYSFPLWLVTDY